MEKQEQVEQWIANGEKAFKKRDYKKALQWFRKAAEQDDDRAMKRIGDMYFCGWGVKEDWVIARDWYDKAYDKGNSEAGMQIEKMIHIIELSI